MSYRETLVHEINTRIDDLQSRGEMIAATWLAHGICAEHNEGLAPGREEDAEFFHWCAYTAVRDLVRREINRRGSDTEREYRPAQIMLPGFEREHIQDYYLVKRDTEEVMVPIVAMSDDEVRQKIALYQSMAESNMAHAQELDRFLTWRADRQIAVAAE